MSSRPGVVQLGKLILGFGLVIFLFVFISQYSN